MIKSLFIIGVFLLLVSCRNYENISLLHYADQADLNNIGLNQEIIKKINDENMIVNGNSRYDNYLIHHYGEFDMLLNSKNPNELYVVKDGIFLVGIRDNGAIELYDNNTKFPNPSSLSVFWMPKQSNVILANKEKVYFDMGINGVDAVFQKLPHTGEKSYLNYVDIVNFLPQSDIEEAFIDNLQCKALVGHYACCTSNGQNYDAYQFQDIGWQKSTNKKVMQYCQSKDLSQLRKRLRQEIYKD